MFCTLGIIRISATDIPADEPAFPKWDSTLNCRRLAWLFAGEATKAPEAIFDA
jgi:hypothetical protein